MSRQPWQYAIDNINTRLAALQGQVGVVATLPLARVQRARISVPGGIAAGSADFVIAWPATWPNPVRYQVLPTLIMPTAADVGVLAAVFKAGSATAVDVIITVANVGSAQTGPFALDVLGIQGV